MSSALPPRPRVIGPKVRICIVASKYNEQYTDALVDNTVEELGVLVPNARIDVQLPVAGKRGHHRGQDGAERMLDGGGFTVGHGQKVTRWAGED